MFHVYALRWLYTHPTPIARSVNQNGLRNFTVLEPRAKRFILFIFDLLFVVLTLYSVAGLKPISAFGSTLASTTVSWDIKLSTQRIINHKHISIPDILGHMLDPVSLVLVTNEPYMRR